MIVTGHQTKIHTKTNSNPFLQQKTVYGDFGTEKSKFWVRRSAQVKSKRATIESFEVFLNFILIYWLENSAK